MTEQDEYTPTTEQVRLHYSVDPEAEYHDPINYPLTVKANERAFDRWLARHDREVLDAAKPRVVETADELDKLPVRSVVIRKCGSLRQAWQKGDDVDPALPGHVWWVAGSNHVANNALMIGNGPVTVLWEGGE